MSILLTGISTVRTVCWDTKTEKAKVKAGHTQRSHETEQEIIFESDLHIQNMKE